MSQVWILELLFRDRETEVSCNSSLKFECQQCKRSCATVASLLPRSISNVFRPVFCLQVNYTVLLIWIQISPTHLSTDVTVWTYVSSPLTVVCVQNLNKYKLNNQMNHFFSSLWWATNIFFKPPVEQDTRVNLVTTVKTMTRLECRHNFNFSLQFSRKTRVWPNFIMNSSSRPPSGCQRLCVRWVHTFDCVFVASFVIVSSRLSLVQFALKPGGKMQDVCQRSKSPRGAQCVFSSAHSVNICDTVRGLFVRTDDSLSWWINDVVIQSRESLQSAYS